MIRSPVVLRTVPWEPLGILTKIREIIKVYGPTDFWTRAHCLKSFCPHLTAEIIFLKKKK